jgi:hypothetical protein
MVIRLAAAARNASTDAVVDLIDGGAGAGTLKIYTGPQVATGDTAESGTLLATVTLIDPAFGASASGTATASDPAAVDPGNTGTAGWFRVEDSTGANVFDGSVTATGGGGDLQLSNTSLAPGINVDITSFTYTTPAG